MRPAADTIAAIATATGRGGIGIVRVSGPGSREIAAAIAGAGIEPRRVSHRNFRAADGSVIDSGIVLLFAAPASYTGEDVLELHGHGGGMVTQLLLRRVIDLGARPARPGEFTERAFLNGRLDLLQAEAVADLIDSQSERAVRSAARVLEGEFSRRVGALQDGLTDLRVAVEAELDFPEEDIGRSRSAALAAGADAWMRDLHRVQSAARAGNALRAGFRIVIAGAANVGKSSLLNRLTGVDRAIVHATPGTTRDVIESQAMIGGIHAEIVDTAGVRTTADAAEQEGVQRALRALDQADVALIVSEYGGERAPGEVLDRVRRVPRRIWVRNKIDLCGVEPAAREQPDGWEVALCARNGAGVGLLREILERVTAGEDAQEDALLAQTRHLHALEEAGAAVLRMARLAGQGGALELAAEELRQAQSALGRITGAVSADDLLGEIFSRFCIGK